MKITNIKILYTNLKNKLHLSKENGKKYGTVTKLHEIKLTFGIVTAGPLPEQRQDTVLTQVRIGHIYLTFVG